MFRSVWRPPPLYDTKWVNGVSESRGNMHLIWSMSMGIELKGNRKVLMAFTSLIKIQMGMELMITSMLPLSQFHLL